MWRSHYMFFTLICLLPPLSGKLGKRTWMAATWSSHFRCLLGQMPSMSFDLGIAWRYFPALRDVWPGIFDDLKVPILKKGIHIITYAILCLYIYIYIYIYGCKSKCTGRSVPWTHRPIHTPDPYQNEGDPDRSILPDHRGPIHTRILTEPHI